MAESRGAGGAGQPRHVDVILHGDGDPIERPKRAACRMPVAACGRRPQRPLRVDRDKAPQLRVVVGDIAEQGLRGVDGIRLAAREPLREDPDLVSHGVGR